MINISTLFDPRYIFLILAPILFAFNKSVGHRAILALTITEWMNQILKWLLAGDRPYWYVHERANELANKTLALDQPHDGYLLPELKQFHVTCELGAGSPSGHAMVTATVLYIIIEAYLKGELGIKSEGATRWAVKAIWSIYMMALVAVSLSRVYLACHFPHQCLGGAICGLMVAQFVSEKMPMHRLRRHHFAIGTAFMFASAFGVYIFLLALGFDPLWSVGKGTRWCIKKEYIHMDTTPFFSMMRYLGFALGPGLAYSYARSTADGSSQQANSCHNPEFISNKSEVQEVSENEHLLWASKALGACMSIIFGQLIMSLPIPRTNLILFYLISFLSYTLFSFAITYPIPQLARYLLGVETGSTRRKQS